MTIGVVIPLYNEEHSISRTLEALFPHAFHELVIVDGGSTDGTLPLARSLCQGQDQVTFTILSSPQGRARQMNAGAANMASEVILFLHADTLLPSQASFVIEQALSDPSCVGGRFDVQFAQDQGYAWVVSRMMNLRSRLSGIATGDQALFVRKSVFEELGGFAEIPIMEDIDFTRRLKRIGQLAALRSKVTTSFRRWEQQGPLRTILLMWALRGFFWLGLNPHTLYQYYKTVR